MNFIPDSFEKNIRLTVKLKDGKLMSFGGKALPKIKNDTIIDIIFPAHSIEQEKDLAQFLALREEAVLKQKTTVLCRLYDNQTGKKYEIPIVLLDELRIFYKGDESLGKCKPCRCLFEDRDRKKIQAGSLNEAYTRLSEIYQKKRRSHSGNIFQKIFYQDEEGRCQSLSQLRDKPKA